MTDTDPRPLLAIALDLTSDLVAGVRPDQLDGPTPCTGFTVRDLAAHLVDVHLRIGDVGRGEPAFRDFQPVRRPSGPDLADDALAAAAKEAAATAVDSWRDDESLTRLVELPWATLPGAVQLLTYLNELTVHAWDLATATGQPAAFDERVVAVAYDAIRRALPADQRDQAPFADVVEVPDDAPLVERLVAWNGRRP